MIDEPNDFPFDRAAMLLHVVETAAKHGTQFSAIASEATRELREMNAELVVVQQDRAKVAEPQPEPVVEPTPVIEPEPILPHIERTL